MAERAEPARVDKQPSGARPKYPWNDWMDGAWWRLYEGKDYATKTLSFRSVAYQQAGRHGYKLHTQLTPDGLFIRFERKESE